MCIISTTVIKTLNKTWFYLGAIVLSCSRSVWADCYNRTYSGRATYIVEGGPFLVNKMAYR